MAQTEVRVRQKVGGCRTRRGRPSKYQEFWRMLSEGHKKANEGDADWRMKIFKFLNINNPLRSSSSPSPTKICDSIVNNIYNLPVITTPMAALPGQTADATKRVTCPNGVSSSKRSGTKSGNLNMSDNAAKVFSVGSESAVKVAKKTKKSAQKSKTCGSSFINGGSKYPSPHRVKSSPRDPVVAVTPGRRKRLLVKLPDPLKINKKRVKFTRPKPKFGERNTRCKSVAKYSSLRKLSNGVNNNRSTSERVNKRLKEWLLRDSNGTKMIPRLEIKVRTAVSVNKKRIKNSTKNHVSPPVLPVPPVLPIQRLPASSCFTKNPPQTESIKEDRDGLPTTRFDEASRRPVNNVPPCPLVPPVLPVPPPLASSSCFTNNPPLTNSIKEERIRLTTMFLDEPLNLSLPKVKATNFDLFRTFPPSSCVGEFCGSSSNQPLDLTLPRRTRLMEKNISR